MIAMYPGTFDPLTLGHENIIARAAAVFDTLWVAVAPDSKKAKPLLDADERMALAKQVTSHLPNVHVCVLTGLLVDCARAHEAEVVVRSVRNSTDFDAECQLAQMNQQLDHGIETMFFFPQLTYAGICARLVREIWVLGGDVSPFVSSEVAQYLNKKR